MNIIPAPNSLQVPLFQNAMIDLTSWTKSLTSLVPLFLLGCAVVPAGSTDNSEAEMDEMWGEEHAARSPDNRRGNDFSDKNYAMFIHFGLYSDIAGVWKGKTWYGIAEWIMHPRMANIPIPEYSARARDFNPTEFDADAIVRLAKDAGMKTIVFTAKHHDGFAMYASKADAFNIVDATPFTRDPLRELADACAKHNIGLGVYYSHYQDWTAPGGGRGPRETADGTPVGFDHYFQTKCLPQIEELTANYGPLDLIWFDTPGDIPKSAVEELIRVIRKNQPRALVNSRAGHGLGDYVSLGDMEVPAANVEGLWETVDTTNNSWGHAAYDQNWKSPDEIIKRLVSTVARGGTYMLNIGPKGDGSVPEPAERALRKAGDWIRRNADSLYGAKASPWGHALPWGDVTRKENELNLFVFKLPPEGILHLPGLKSDVVSASLEDQNLQVTRKNGWTLVHLPSVPPDTLPPVIRLRFAEEPVVDPVWGVDPALPTVLSAQFATADGAELSQKRWMQKFGEWKHVHQVGGWKPGAAAIWEVEVFQPGTYLAELTVAGEGQTVWSVEVEGGESMRNAQPACSVYTTVPVGWIHIPQPGPLRLRVSCLEGNLDAASLKALHLSRVDL